MATWPGTWTTAPKSIRWRCSWAATSRRSWRIARGWRSAWGYDEINLNCGCPSERVQRGAFGACLMAEPQRVADGVKAMRDAVDLPVTVKHRIGIDRIESYDFVRDFVGTVAAGRLRGLHRACAQCLAAGPEPEGQPRIAAAALRHRAPAEAATFRRCASCSTAASPATSRSPATCGSVDGVMVGREAYHHPWSMAAWDAAFLGAVAPAEPLRREDIEAAMVGYMQQMAAQGQPWTPRVAAHAGPVERHTRRAPLAPGVERPPAEGPAAGASRARGAAGARR